MWLLIILYIYILANEHMWHYIEYLWHLTTQKVSKIEIGVMDCTWSNPQHNYFHLGFENIK
jgi:hypothetical protein